ncbi:MAG TPA: dienelactone hydrolase family protein [Caulobacteraceae bacterium]|jgi:carboxymethylenebutenolidase|nr:dienelactone hydrolase family protein [Caulobacteraceae bacterium]
MGEAISLTSKADGFVLDAYHVTPDDARHGGLVLVQEIFGVTEHIRELCDGFAADGYEVIAPSFYDRQERGFAARYDADGVAKGRLYSEAAPWDLVQGDLQAAIDALKGPVFVTGFCWGGTAAWLAACRCDGVAAAACYYGRRIPELIAETPRCPTILHFGKRDPTIPPEVVEQIREAFPDLPVYVYEAGHGFASDRRADYEADSARLARLRTLQLFTRSSGVRAEI